MIKIKNKLGLSWAKLSTAGIELELVVRVGAIHENFSLLTSNRPKDFQLTVLLQWAIFLILILKGFIWGSY